MSINIHIKIRLVLGILFSLLNDPSVDQPKQDNVVPPCSLHSVTWSFLPPY